MKSGFTIYEVIVTVVVMALLTSLAILYSRTNERQIRLFNSEHLVLNALSRAKALTLATRGPGAAPCGYGVHFMEPNTFLIFKDTAADCKTSDKKYSGGAEDWARYQLEDGITFSSLSLSDVLFMPPDPKIFIFDQAGNPVFGAADMVLKTDDNQSQVTVEINTAGQITTK